MSVLVVGISHRTAPVALLEKVIAGVGDTGQVLGELAGVVNEAVVLATCNRLEVYVDTDSYHPGHDAVTALLARRSHVPVDDLLPHLYAPWEDQAVLHLFRVASGLDSMVVGESQILGQLRKAYAGATETTGRVLHELFQTALKVGKRVHTETGIDAAGQSLVTVGLEQAAAAVGPLTGRSALVVGAGSMGSLASSTLRRLEIGDLVVANRTPDSAIALAARYGGTGTGLDGLRDALVTADLVVSSTGATGIVLSLEEVAAAVVERQGRPLALLDLALPHDVDPAVRALPGVTLVDLVDLQQALNGSSAAHDVHSAEAVVDQEVAAFSTWQRADRVAPTVVALRSRAAEVVAAELARLDNRVTLTEQERAEVEQTVRRVVATLLHNPTVRVKELVDSPGLSFERALRELFGLDLVGDAT